MTPSLTFCPLLWAGLSTTNDGALRPCCVTWGSVCDRSGRPYRLLDGTESIESYWNSPAIRKARLDMLAGRWPDFCRGCKDRERSGGSSLRGHHLIAMAGRLDDLAASTQSDGSAPTVLSYVDLHLGNLCNLRCRMCFPKASHLVARDWGDLGLDRPGDAAWRDPRGLDPQAVERALEPHLDGVDMLYFSGGEPLLSPAHDRILDLLVERGAAERIALRYTTNGTVLPESVIERWTRFRRVEVGVSVDAVGPLARYIRYPTDWATVQGVMERLDALPLAMVTVLTTVQALNAPRLAEIIDWIPRFKRVSPMPTFSVLTDPSCMDARVLPRAVRQRAADDLIDACTRHGLDRAKVEPVVTFLTGEDREHLLPDFLARMRLFDGQRRQRLSDLLPEIAPIYCG